MIPPPGIDGGGTAARPTDGARRDPIPGLRPALGITLLWVGLIVVLPLTALALRPWELGVAGVVDSLAQPRVLAALRLSFGAALLAALLDVPLGLLIAWVLTRQRFSGRRLMDAAVDLPLALPTAVAGIALATLYAPNGWLGAPLGRLGFKVAFGLPGIVVALMFVALPFVVRGVQPLLIDLSRDMEEAAASLGATRRQTLWRVVLPAIAPGLITGFGLAIARAIGEFGSVIFIAGNMPGRTEIAPLLIVTRLEQYDYAGAAALALAMLLLSAVLLALIGLLRRAFVPVFQ